MRWLERLVVVPSHSAISSSLLTSVPCSVALVVSGRRYIGPCLLLIRIFAKSSTVQLSSQLSVWFVDFAMIVAWCRVCGFAESTRGSKGNALKVRGLLPMTRLSQERLEVPFGGLHSISSRVSRFRREINAIVALEV